jgi:ribosomal protein S18 acetylase RimI-like enzyme
MPQIRPFRPGDLDRLREITVEAFNGVSIDQNAEAMFGLINGRDWRWRKGRHVDDDARREPAGIFVLAEGDEVLGGITTWIDREAGIGHIPNLALAPQVRGQGWGRRLIEHALEHFRQHGVAFARIETLDQNEVGQRLYTSLGFREAARQIHYFMPLDTAADSKPENTP